MLQGDKIYHSCFANKFQHHCYAAARIRRHQYTLLYLQVAFQNTRHLAATQQVSETRILWLPGYLTNSLISLDNPFAYHSAILLWENRGHI